MAFYSHQEVKWVVALLALTFALDLVAGRLLHQDAPVEEAVLADLQAESTTSTQFAWDSQIGIINGRRPVVIAHRGASGELPEHTLEAYRRAIAEGADCIECDVVVTKDLQLICRHEPWLQNTTDAFQKFGDYETTYNLPEAGGDVSGIFSIDLTLDEIRTLRAAMPQPWRDQSYNYQLRVPTFAEYVEVANNVSNPKVTCIYPETKHPKFFNNHPVLQQANTTIDDLLMTELERLGYNLQAQFGSPEWLQKPVFVQSFEQDNLRYWAGKTKVPLVQLVDSEPAADTGNTAEYLLSEPGIQEIAQYAWGYAPWKGLYIVTDANNTVVEINPEPVGLAHKYGMPVTVWTLRNEPSYLATTYNGNIANEYNLLFNVLGVNGGFTDHPYSLVKWVLSEYKPAAAEAADQAAAGNTSAFVTAGTPSWAQAPVCQVQPSATSQLAEDAQGNPWLTDRGISCAYWYPGSRAVSG